MKPDKQLMRSHQHNGSVQVGPWHRTSRESTKRRWTVTLASRHVR